jgi:c(7)-type cytochrome triheme protein
MRSKVLVAFIMAALAGGALPAGALELKDITMPTENAGKVIFSHKSHMNKKKPKTAGFNCKACHNNAMEKNRRYTMAEMEKGKSCGACHNGKQAFALAKCTTCHKVREITFKVKETGPVNFSHTRHLRKMTCATCHNSIYKAGPNARIGMAEMEKGKSCGACHDGKKAFPLASCTACHPVKDRLYKLDAGNCTFSHTVHLGMYKCGECHPGIYLPGKGNKVATMTDMEKGASCGACHDGKTAFTVKENCDKCHK